MSKNLLLQLYILLSFLFTSSLLFGQEKVSFQQALDLVKKNNKALSSVSAEIDKFKSERNSAYGLYMPKISLEAKYTYINDDIVIDLSDVRTAMIATAVNSNMAFAQTLHPTLPPDQLQALAQGVESSLNSGLPKFETKVQDRSFFKANILATMPIFVGGKIFAANDAKEAMITGAVEKKKNVENELITELVVRYYGTILLEEVVEVRKKVLDGIKKHLEVAKKLEEQGVIAKAERLHAEVYHAEAKREFNKALKTFEITKAGLKNTVSVDKDIIPTSKMFINKDIPELKIFISKAQEKNPLLKLIDSKKELAKQNYNVKRSSMMPQVFLFGMKELYEDDLTILDPKWAVGVGAKFTIFEGLSNYNDMEAAQFTKKQIQEFSLKAKSDIETLVEKRYNELNMALDEFESTKATLEFAEEYLRVRTRAFEEGLATSVEVIDAQLMMSKVKIAELSSAYSFDVALANLLEATGESNNFELYLTNQNTEFIND